MTRLAQRLAKVRSGNSEPGSDCIQMALPRRGRKMYHGVDMNIMSVEICKIALWLEFSEPGKSLSFLDTNIQCGNALLGIRPEQMQRELNAEYFSIVKAHRASTKFATESPPKSFRIQKYLRLPYENIHKKQPEIQSVQYDEISKMSLGDMLC